MRNDRKNLITEKSMQLGLEILHFCDLLKSKNVHPHLIHQILKCGTSVGANVHEAQNAETLKDFIHKFKIACKECDELIYWINLLKQSHYQIEVSVPEKLATENMAIISKIISSSKNRMYRSNDTLGSISESQAEYISHETIQELLSIN